MHSAVGGVTDAKLCITAIASRPFILSNDPQAPCYAPRDASTVLGLKPSCFSFRPAPTAATTSPLRVVKLGVQGHQPFFHGGGLLAYPLTKRTLVLTPTLFAPKNHWGLRCLGVQEALECLDWPVALATIASTLPRPPLSSLLPLKCLVNGFRALLGSSFDQRIDRKRQRENDTGLPITARTTRADNLLSCQARDQAHGKRLAKTRQTASGTNYRGDFLLLWSKKLGKFLLRTKALHRHLSLQRRPKSAFFGKLAKEKSSRQMTLRCPTTFGENILSTMLRPLSDPL